MRASTSWPCGPRRFTPEWCSPTPSLNPLQLSDGVPPASPPSSSPPLQALELSGSADAHGEPIDIDLLPSEAEELLLEHALSPTLRVTLHKQNHSYRTKKTLCARVSLCDEG